MSINIVITNAGRAALVNAQNTGTLPVVITQVGLSQTSISPTPSTPSLAGEFKRVSGIGGDSIAPDTIHINMTDTSADAYSLRSFALYLADGTLFGIYGQAAPILEKVTASDALLAIDVVFADISAASLTFGNTNYLNPPATTERQGVVELATVSEAQAGIDALRALTPASAKAAILGWLLAQDGSGSGLDADMLDGLHAAAFARLSGAAFSGDLSVVGSGGAYAAMNTNGDITANRGNNTGVYYFTGSGTRYFYFNGGGFDLVGGQLAVNSAIVWNLANDGSGSGLDADYIDGLDSSQLVVVGPGTSRQGDVTLARATASNDAFGGLELREAGLVGPAQSSAAYAPGVSFHWRDRAAARLYMNAGGQFVLGGQSDIATNRRDLLAANVFSYGNLCWSAGNDGSGSGLDADLLDGYDSSQFLRANSPVFNHRSGSANGYLQFNEGNSSNPGFISFHTADLVRRGFVGWNNGANRMVLASENGWAWAFYDTPVVGGSAMWHAGNDGSGSGLDADLLDGFQAAAFRRIVQRNPVENGGFYVYDDGLIETWGFVDIGPNTAATFNLPVQHQQWVNPTISRMQSRYGDTNNTENIYLTSIDVDGSARPASITIWNADNFNNRVFIQTKGY